MLLTLLLACGSDTPEDTDPSDASIVLLPEGGTFASEGLTLELPPGAVDAPTEITLELADVPAPYVGHSPRFVVTPAVDFLVPVEVSVADVGADARFWELADTWRQRPGAVQGGALGASVDRVSELFAADNAEVTEVFVVTPNAEVDLLVVVDDSSSGGSEVMGGLTQRIGTLVDTLDDAGVDWRIGVATNADTSDTLLEHDSGSFVTPETSDAIATLEALVDPGIDYLNITEQGRDVVYRILDTNADAPQNAGFVRDTAELHILLTSSDEDYSSAITPLDFVDWMNVSGSTVHAWAPTNPPTCGTADEGSIAYTQYTDRTGGRFLDLCEFQGLPGFMTDVANDAAGHRVRALLTSAPDPATVTVETSTASFAGDAVLTVDRRVTVPDHTVPAGSEVAITYLPL